MSQTIEIAELTYKPIQIRKRLDGKGVRWVAWMQGYYSWRQFGKTLEEALVAVARLIDKEKP